MKRAATIAPHCPQPAASTPPRVLVMENCWIRCVEGKAHTMSRVMVQTFSGSWLRSQGIPEVLPIYVGTRASGPVVALLILTCLLAAISPERASQLIEVDWPLIPAHAVLVRLLIAVANIVVYLIPILTCTGRIVTSLPCHDHLVSLLLPLLPLHPRRRRTRIFPLTDTLVR